MTRGRRYDDSSVVEALAGFPVKKGARFKPRPLLVIEEEMMAHRFSKWNTEDRDNSFAV
jgi:hypothetical protein